jgi:hypothetical protein
VCVLDLLRSRHTSRTCAHQFSDGYDARSLSGVFAMVKQTARNC